MVGTTLKPFGRRDLRRKTDLWVPFSLTKEFTFGIVARIRFITEDRFDGTSRTSPFKHSSPDDPHFELFLRKSENFVDSAKKWAYVVR